MLGTEVFIFLRCLAAKVLKPVAVLLSVSIRMITDAIRKSTNQYRLPRMMPDCIRG